MIARLHAWSNRSSHPPAACGPPPRRSPRSTGRSRRRKNSREVMANPPRFEDLSTTRNQWSVILANECYEAGQKRDAIIKDKDEGAQVMQSEIDSVCK